MMPLLPLFNQYAALQTDDSWNEFVTGAFAEVSGHCNGTAKFYNIQDPQNSAQEATVAAFAKIRTHAGQRHFPNEAAFRTWMRLVAQTTTMDECEGCYRRERRERTFLIDPPAKSAPRPDFFQRRPEVVIAMPELLTPLQMRVVILRALDTDGEEKSFEAIAKALGLRNRQRAARIFKEAVQLLRDYFNRGINND